MHSNYNKVSETSMPVDEVEAWLNEFEHKRAENRPNGGIIRSTETVIFVNGTRANMTKSERRMALRKAKKEHKAALRELAIQDRNDKVAIARKQKEWAKEVRSKRKPDKSITVCKKELVESRCNALEARIKSGEHVLLPSHEGETKNDYNTMRRDILSIRSRIPEGIVRLKVLGETEAHWAADRIENYDGEVDCSDVDSVAKALMSGKALRVRGDMYQKEVKNLANLVGKARDLHELNIVVIYGLSNSRKGWVVKK